MVSINKDIMIEESDVKSMFDNFDALLSNVQILDEQRRQLRKLLDAKWALQNHKCWRGVRIVSEIVSRTREKGEKVGRTQFMLKELKASRNEILASDKAWEKLENAGDIGIGLWEQIQKVLGLDESGLMIDEDMFLTFAQLEKGLESEGSSQNVLKYLRTPEVIEKLQALHNAGEGKLVEDVKKLLSDVSQIRELSTQRLTVLNKIGARIPREENAESLNELIHLVRLLTRYLERYDPKGKLLESIKSRKVLMHLKTYIEEIQYLQGLLEKVRKGKDEGMWQDFFDFYHEENTSRFKEHVKKIRDEYGDAQTAGALRSAGANLKEYGDQPDKWFNLLGYLVQRLQSPGHMKALAVVGRRSLIIVIREEKARIDRLVRKLLMKNIGSIKGKVGTRIKKLKDIRSVIKSLVKAREKVLFEFLKRTKKEFTKQEEYIAKIYQDAEESLNALRQTDVRASVEPLRKSSEYRVRSMPAFIDGMNKARDAAQRIAADPKNPYNFSPLYALLKIMHYLYNLETIEDAHVEKIRNAVFQNIPMDMKKVFTLLLKMYVVLESSISDLNKRGFVSTNEAFNVKRSTEITNLRGGVNA
jgi:hypothetical protein